MFEWLKKRWNCSMPINGVREIGPILSVSWKLSVMTTLIMNFGIISTVACGHMGKLHLDGVALASTIISIAGMNVGWGMGSAFDTLFAQSFGSSDKKRTGVFLQTGVIFLGGTCLICVTLFVNSYAILVALGQDPAVARITEEYLLYFSPGLLCIFGFILLSKYMQSQNIINVILIIELVAFLMNVALQYLLIYQAGLGVKGSAMAHAITFFFMAALLLIYMLLSGAHKLTWTAWSLDCLEDWGKVGKLSLSALILCSVEWCSIEGGILLLGTLGAVALGAAVILFQIMTFLYAISGGVTVHWIYKIGRCLGRGDSDSARRYANASILMSIVLSLILVSLMLSIMTVAPKMFTDDNEIGQLTTSLFPYTAIFLFCDSIKNQISGVFRACGKQFLAAVTSFIFFTAIAYSLAVPLIFFTPLQSLGFWIGIDTGCIVCLVCLFVIFVKIDWGQETEKAAERVKGKQSDDVQVVTENTKLLHSSDSGHRNRRYLILKPIVVALPIVSAFVISVTFRIISQTDYADTVKNGTFIT